MVLKSITQRSKVDPKNRLEIAVFEVQQQCSPSDRQPDGL